MTAAEFRVTLRDKVPEYVAQASVTRNAHMNQWRGDDPDPALSTALVDRLLDLAGDVPTFIPTFTEAMKQAARKAVAEPDDVPTELRKAVLVDFINWAAGRFWCCDLALYTTDLEAE